jgi:hypothetical protein
MPEGAGLLLEQTYRMQPGLCRYTSGVFYDTKPYGVNGRGRQEICARYRSPGRACEYWKCRARAT